MQASERWSSTAWVVALVANVLLCIVLAARVHVHPPPVDDSLIDSCGVGRT